MMITQENKSYIDSIDKIIMPFVQYGDYSDRYPALSAFSFNKYFYSEIRAASKALFAIFEKTVKIFQQTPKQFQEQMEIPQKLIPFLNIPNALNLSTWLSRFDFVLDENNDFKVVEINSIYNDVHEYCSDYQTEENAYYSVTTSKDDISYERRRYYRIGFTQRTYEKR